MKSHRAQQAKAPTSNHSVLQGPEMGSSNAALLEAMAAEQTTQVIPPPNAFEGAVTSSRSQSAFAVKSRQDVEKRSVANKDDAQFQAMNENYRRGFTFDYDQDGAAPSKTAVRVGVDGDDTRADEKAIQARTGVTNVADWKKMVTDDFDFNGVVERYAGPAEDAKGNAIDRAQRRSAGEAGFLTDVVKRFYPDLNLEDPAVQPMVEIARNLWSYATTGTDATGNIDIEQMQGLLYAFDAQIRNSSNTNTKMKDPTREENYFIVPGTESWTEETHGFGPIRLLEGDDRHGRATILTTRHLLGDMTNSGLEGYDESYLALDRSSSMRGDEFPKLGKLLGAGGIDGKVALGGFDADASTLKKVDNGRPMTPERANQALEAATLHAKDGHTEAYKDDPLAGTSGKAMHEEGIGTALQWVKDLKAAGASPNVSRQFVVVTDEPDFSPEKLAALKQETAGMKNVSIKVLYSFDSNERDQRLSGASPNAGLGGSINSDKYMVVSLDEIDQIDPAWLVTRTEKNEQGEEVENQQLDWARVGRAQGAAEYYWPRAPQAARP